MFGIRLPSRTSWRVKGTSVRMSLVAIYELGMVVLWNDKTHGIMMRGEFGSLWRTNLNLALWGCRVEVRGRRFAQSVRNV